MKKSALAALLIPLLFLFLATPISALELGETAPDFELSTLDGKKVRLSDFKGRIIVLKLATTWCPTCKQQSEEIAHAGSFLKERDIPVIDVFLQDSAEMVRRYMKEHDYVTTHVALQDDGRARRSYNVYLIPRVLIIDREFKVRQDVNMITSYDLRRNISRIAGEN
jgi:peroxiredoxin